MSWLKKHREARVTFNCSPQAEAGQQEIIQFVDETKDDIKTLENNPLRETVSRALLVPAAILAAMTGERFHAKPRKPYQLSEEVSFAASDLMTVCQYSARTLRSLAEGDGSNELGIRNLADRLTALIESPNFAVLLQEYAAHERAIQGRGRPLS